MPGNWPVPFGKARRKRTRATGTSAAYFTLWEPEGAIPSGDPTIKGAHPNRGCSWGLKPPVSSRALAM